MFFSYNRQHCMKECKPTRYLFIMNILSLHLRFFFSATSLINNGTQIMLQFYPVSLTFVKGRDQRNYTYTVKEVQDLLSLI